MRRVCAWRVGRARTRACCEPSSERTSALEKVSCQSRPHPFSSDATRWSSGQNAFPRIVCNPLEVVVSLTSTPRGARGFASERACETPVTRGLRCDVADEASADLHGSSSRFRELLNRGRLRSGADSLVNTRDAVAGDERPVRVEPCLARRVSFRGCETPDDAEVPPPDKVRLRSPHVPDARG